MKEDGGTGSKEVHICEYERDRQRERGERETEREMEREERERGGGESRITLSVYNIMLHKAKVIIILL